MNAKETMEIVNKSVITMREDTGVVAMMAINSKMIFTDVKVIQ